VKDSTIASSHSLPLSTMWRKRKSWAVVTYKPVYFTTSVFIRFNHIYMPRTTM